MCRLAAVCAAGLVATLSGCTTARYVEKTSDGGVVAVADASNEFPYYNRDHAIDLITRHVGPDYEIVKEEETVTGKRTLSDQHVTQVPARDPVIPFLATNQTVVTESQVTEDVKQWYIHYRKKLGGTTPTVQQHVGPDGLIRVGVDFNATATKGSDGPPLPSLVPPGQ
jgi:hypothetical protein